MIVNSLQFAQFSSLTLALYVKTFLYQILAGLRLIHSSSVIHRDLVSFQCSNGQEDTRFVTSNVCHNPSLIEQKPANILLNEDCSLKVRTSEW